MSRAMPALTVERLRDELASFARGGLRTELQAIQESILTELLTRAVPDLGVDGQKPISQPNHSDMLGLSTLLNSWTDGLMVEPNHEQSRSRPGPDDDDDEVPLLPPKCPGSLATVEILTPKRRPSRVSESELGVHLSSNSDFQRAVSPDFDLPSKRFTRCARQIIFSQAYIRVCCGVICINAIAIAALIDYQARQLTSATPLQYDIANIIFLIFFTIDISLRIHVHGVGFCEWFNNWFDLCLVVVLFVEVSGYLALLPRTLHLLRMGRIFRVVRALRLFEELDNLIESIWKSWRFLVWSLILFSIITLAFGVFITHSVSSYKIERTHTTDMDDKLDQYYGTLDRAFLALYAAISDGIHWTEVMEPITDCISPLWSVVFVTYTSIFIFAIMNVVTSFFVENTRIYSELSRSRKLATAVADLFTIEGSQGEITRELFNSAIDTQAMDAYLTALEWDPEHFELIGVDMFDLIDADHSGSIDIGELVSACMRLRGSAKQIDFHAFLVEYRRDMKRMRRDFNIRASEFQSSESAPRERLASLG